jgi:peptide/nickel transport system ATP-binding protein
MTEDIVTIRDLEIAYQTAGVWNTALHSVDLSIKAGERLAIVGESGSGKTTLGMAIGGFLPPSAARLTAKRFRVNGSDDTDIDPGAIPRHRPGVSMVFQDANTSLDPVWTIGSQLIDVARGARSGGSRRSRKEAHGIARDWLLKVGMRDVDRVMKRRPYELSGGMRQRAMVALALCSEPQLLIADEPTSALDVALAREMMELLTALVRDLGSALMIISHDIELCTEYSDRTAVMYGGRVVEINDSKQIVSQAEHPYTVALTRCIPNLGSATNARLDTVPALDPAFAENTVTPVLSAVDLDRPGHLVSNWNPGFDLEAITLPRTQGSAA